MSDIDELKKQLQIAEDEAKIKTKALETTLTTVSLLYQINSELGLIEDTEKLYTTFLEKVLQLFGVEIGIFYVVDKDTKEYTSFFSLGLRHDEQDLLRGPLSGSIFEDILLNRTMRLVSTEGVQLLSPIFSKYPIKATLLAPVDTKSGVVAIAQFSRLYDEPFTTEDERVMRILLNKLASSLDIVSSQEKLRTKTNELERMNKLMVDRELKMVELKAEIAALKAGQR